MNLHQELSSAHLHLSLMRARSCLAEHVNSHSSNDYICLCQSVGPLMAFSEEFNPLAQADLNKT